MEDGETEPENVFRRWYPRDILSRTNWLYRVDALRNRDIRDMRVLSDLFLLFRRYAMGFLLWASTLASQVHLGIQPQEKLKKVINVILQMCQLLLSEGYCYFLDFLEIAYYPITNRFTNANNGPQFRPVVNSIINEWSVSEARELTGFTIPQLLKLLTHLRIPDTMRYTGYYRFRGEEAMLHYLYWMRVGRTTSNECKYVWW